MYNILICDDEPDIVSALKIYLAGEDYRLFTASDGEEALRIARALPLELNLELLESAALLHDLARGEKDHASLGAAWLRELGYEDAAALVGQHHDLKSRTPDEAAILYLADKCVQEDRRVTLEERFAGSESRCRTAEAKKAHRARLLAALALRDEINRICGKTVVE